MPLASMFRHIRAKGWTMAETGDTYDQTEGAEADAEQLSPEQEALVAAARQALGQGVVTSQPSDVLEASGLGIGYTSGATEDGVLVNQPALVMRVNSGALLNADLSADEITISQQLTPLDAIDFANRLIGFAIDEVKRREEANALVEQAEASDAQAAAEAAAPDEDA